MHKSAQRTSLQVISTGGLYGAERALLEIAAHMQENNWNSHIVVLEGKGAGALLERARAMNLSAEAFGSDRVDVRTLRKQLNLVIKRFPVGVIHSHGYKPDILLWAMGLARRWICISTCHTWYRETWKMRLWEHIDKRVLRGFDAVIPVSGQLKEELLASGVSAERIKRIDNGIDVPAANPKNIAGIRGELNLSANDRLIVQIGRLAKSKRNDLLIESLALVPTTASAHVVFVGDGEELNAIKRLVDQHQLGQRVHFAGYRTDISAFLGAADALAITSDHEGLPIILLEAMAARCPIVSTRVGAIPEVLIDGHSAWLVPPNDARLFGTALTQAITNPDEALARTTQARATFDARHSRQSMGRQYIDVYERAWISRGFPAFIPN